MEMEEIYNLTIFPLVTSKFSVQWSTDNHISILTERGIHIFEFIPSPMSPCSTIKFIRSFIYAPSTLPTENISNKIESKIWGMQREAVYSFIMEESLTPKLSNLKEMVPKIIDLTWSPQNLIHPSKCLIAILTSAGAVTIAYKISKDWYPAYDLSSIRYNFIEQEINTKLKESKNNSTLFETFKNCLKALQASCFTWSKLFVNFAYFAVAYFNGDIIIYKIPKISDYNEISNPEIIGTIRLNEYIKISALNWVTIDIKKHLIIVGYIDGRIHGLNIEDHDQNIELKFIEKYYDYKDRISISAIRIFPQNDLNIKILVAKGPFLFLFCIEKNGTLKTMEHLQLEGFTISGMTCISTNYALVTTENGLMFSVNTERNQFLKKKVNNKLSQSHVRYLGCAHSPSVVIFINVTSPNTIYDHLVMKEPTKIYMFCLKHKNWDPLTVLNENKHERLEQLWDCLEAIRMKATRALNPTILLSKVPSNLESLSLHELRVVMWTSVMIQVCEKKKVIQGIGSIAGEISEAQPLIFVHSACNYLMRLESRSSLSEQQKLSICLLKMHLEAYLTGEENKKVTPFYKHIKDVLKETCKLNLSNIETCNLCGEIINELPWKVTKCSKGHILPRCPITLLQITTMQYRTCPICSLIFHPCLEKEFEETRCLFCDVPALEENRVLNTKCYIPKEKSLSSLQSHTLQMSEDREMDTVADES
ncbi:uncharacterized protein LOC117155220 [Bombus vancouverensis nearcticus]|uniref:uncharacterized protein LOC117155220 n=1 Tax=Bombus vancouverensis nearcticus TaxID=2705178 RepID=UPI00143C99F1|nr:uncharacterized protein LOC117155220 [Bombus vancouverensis nearcticus]XP_033186846.1 uncharacterized protein LOC117155220 [Bombus vancouverensis nearcticus]XP_033186847.1 uncharacterized protein LOC117155220 [Bombus vancouverensis nearcticus]